MAGNRPGGQGGRTGVLISGFPYCMFKVRMSLTIHSQEHYPQVVEAIIERLEKLQDASTPMTFVTICGIVVATILRMAPKIFEREGKDGAKFQCSDSWLHQWLHRTLNWSECKATWACHKLPKDWEAQCEKSFLWMAHDIKEHDIPEALQVNTDQAQGVYAQGSSFTWAKTGSKQISVVSAEEKRATIIFTSISASSVLLPFQAVYEGKSSASCPKASAKCHQEAMAESFRFEYSGNQTYWSTQKTMRSLVDDIIAPYFSKQKMKLGLPKIQKSIWQIDVWSVHRSKEFRDWMKENHSNIIIHYVPVGCTGVFQPRDVGMQHIMKHSLERLCHQDVVDEILAQVDDGKIDVTVDKTVGVLHDRTVSWLWDAYQTLNDPCVVKKVRPTIK